MLADRTFMLNEYQREAMRTAKRPEDILKDQLSREALGLTGEAGEVADLIKKHLYHGHALDREKLKKELGDVLWYLAVMADHVGFELSAVAGANVEKLRARYPDGFDPERSKNRKAGDL